MHVSTALSTITSTLTLVLHKCAQLRMQSANVMVHNFQTYCNKKENNQHGGRASTNMNKKWNIFNGLGAKFMHDIHRRLVYLHWILSLFITSSFSLSLSIIDIEFFSCYCCLLACMLSRSFANNSSLECLSLREFCENAGFMKIVRFS